VSRFCLSSFGDKRAQKGLRKQIISVFNIIADEMGPHVESVASPYQSDPVFNEREISILFTTVTMLDVREMIIGELKIIFETEEFVLEVGRPSKQITVSLCGFEANSEEVRKLVKRMIHTSDNAVKNLESLMR
jgi:hypothetical protein